MKQHILPILAAILFVCGCCENEKDISCECIWSEDYSAFPSIVKFNGKYYISFREGKSHIFDDNGKAEGKARILVSGDGKKWEPAALLGKDGYDFRDPKLSVTPDGKLLVPSGGDTSYPGFIEVGDRIWMVYYSCHEHSSSAAIYLAKFPKRLFE